MARNAHSDDTDSRGVARMRRLDHPCADPAHRRAAALIPPASRFLRWMRSLARRVLMRTRLGQWALAIRRVRADYRNFTGRTPSLLRPRRFTEKMQWRKLFELDPIFAVLSDKLAARDYVAARIGAAGRPTCYGGQRPGCDPIRPARPSLCAEEHARLRADHHRAGHGGAGRGCSTCDGARLAGVPPWRV